MTTTDQQPDQEVRELQVKTVELSLNFLRTFDAISFFEGSQENLAAKRFKVPVRDFLEFLSRYDPDAKKEKK